MVPAYETGGTWQTRIRAGLTALLAFLDNDRRCGRLLIVESLAAGPSALERRRQRDRTGRCRPVTWPHEGQGEARAARVDGRGHRRRSARSRSSTAVGSRRTEDCAARASARVGGSLDGHDRPPLSGTRRRTQRDRATRAPRPAHGDRRRSDPLQDLPMRLTYRTMRVLVAVAENPGSSNRHVGRACRHRRPRPEHPSFWRRLHKTRPDREPGRRPRQGRAQRLGTHQHGQQVHDSIADCGATPPRPHRKASRRLGKHRLACQLTPVRGLDRRDR